MIVISLLFLMILSSFAGKTRCFMKRINKYDRLCELMEASNESGCFEELCRKAGLSVDKADNYLYGLFGMSGNELLFLLRGSGN